MNSVRIFLIVGLGLSALSSVPAIAADKNSEGMTDQLSEPASQSEWTCPGMAMGPHARGGRSWSRLRDMQRVTIDGRIEDVNIHETCFGEVRGLHLKLKTADDTVFIHVGPTQFVNSKSFPFAIGDDVRVEGALSEGAGTKAVFAYVIEKGGKRLILRDADGRPRWSRGRGEGMGRLSH
ncbi:MAG: hypothetical protein FJ146_19110 [Deltaproteobacteria bacterium]|nr:hypothetical protein [Deltaproteobacteria bacterium]